MSSVGEQVLFSNLCELFNKISKAPKPKKSDILHKFINDWKTLGAKETKCVNSSFLPAMKLLLPQLDRERGAYGIKENTLAKIYIRVLCLPADGKDALRLLNYRAPKNAGNMAGDFAEVAYWVLKDQCCNGGQLSILEINSHLDSIAQKHAENDPRGIDDELTQLLQFTSAEEQKWLLRIILKDLKLGIGEKAILNTFHVDAKDLYDVCNNLTKVCETLADENKRLHEIELELFSPFRPMLSEELAIHNIEHGFNSVPYFYVETKLDGERFQIHMKEGVFKYYSRNGHEYTSNYGSTRFEGILTPHMAIQISDSVKNVILDGEMMAWNTSSKRFTTKGMNIDVKSLKDTHTNRPCFCVFDVLLVNDEVLTNKPLMTRLEKLEKIITPKEGIVMFVQRKKVASKEEVFEILDDAIDSCEEGIILKQYLSVYKPNVRKNGGWYKIKPEYTDSLMDTLDMIIIGGYRGGGRHKGSISHFLLGVINDKAEPRKIMSAARVGSGYSLQELFDLQVILEPHWKETVPGTMPEGFEWTKEKPEVWIEPSKSVVLEVKASEIVPSNAYATGYTLRFPRVKLIRTDKAWTDCMTFSDFEQKRKNCSGKLTSHLLTDIETSPKSKIRKTVRSVYELSEESRKNNLSKVEVVKDLLQGKEICVKTDCGKITKAVIEKKIIKYGGSVTMNPGNSTWCVLAENETLQVKNIISSKLFNVVKCSWMLSYLNRETSSIPEVPRQAFLGLSVVTEGRLSKHYDAYGDHYTVPASTESLKISLEIAGRVKLPKITSEEKLSIVEELSQVGNKYFLFGNLVACAFSLNSTLNVDIELALCDFSYYGGGRTDTIDSTVTHVVCNGSSVDVTHLKALRKPSSSKFHIVTPQWISACIRENRIIDCNI